MAQTGYTPIQLYRSGTSTNVPTASNLTDGELAINTADGKLFYKDNGGNVQTLVDSGGGVGTVTSVGGTGTVNGITLTGTVTSSGNLTLGGALSNVNLTSQVTGTLPIANGGTGLTTVGTAGQALVVNGAGNALEYGSAGVTTGKSIAMSMIFGF